MELEYTLTAEPSEHDHFTGTMALTCHESANAQDDPIETLWFSTPHLFNADSFQGATLSARDGDLHGLTLDTPLYPGENRSIKVRNNHSAMPKYTDRPYGVFGRTRSGQVIPATVHGPTLYWDHRPDPVAQPELATALIPCPARLEPRAGETFPRPETIHWQADTAVALDGFDIAHWQITAQTFARFSLSTQQGWPLSVRTDSKRSPGSYQLDIHTDGGELIAADTAGLHAALSTLIQWFGGKRVQAASLEDSPRFTYRGLHLDVSRHFVPLDEVKRIVRLCALYKINHLHWHLTDDEGWRLEIKRYPQIIERVAWRGPDRIMPPQMGTGGEPHGGYYSQEDVRAVVEMARKLGITLVPEIDVPGHARALLRALPELVETADSSQYQSVQHYDDNVLNPALPETWSVITGILDEVVALFPDTAIHLGSDEVPEGVWEQSPAAQEKARELGLPSVRALHGWFMRALEDYCWSHHGRRVSGWEEVITDQAVSHHTTVYSWQGVDAGREAAELGYSVVMTPAQHCYFDLAYTDQAADPGYYWAGTVSTGDAYLFEPFAGMEDTDASVRQQIRGLQACLWGELLDHADKRAFMLLPRLPALAERAWSGAERRDLEDFLGRCRTHQSLWQADGWHYRAPELGW